MEHTSTGGTDPQSISSDGKCIVHKTRSTFMCVLGGIASKYNELRLIQYIFLKLKFKRYIIKIVPVWC